MVRLVRRGTFPGIIELGGTSYNIDSDCLPQLDLLDPLTLLTADYMRQLFRKEGNMKKSNK